MMTTLHYVVFGVGTLFGYALRLWFEMREEERCPELMRYSEYGELRHERCLFRDGHDGPHCIKVRHGIDIARTRHYWQDEPRLER